MDCINTCVYSEAWFITLAPVETLYFCLMLPSRGRPASHHSVAMLEPQGYNSECAMVQHVLWSDKGSGLDLKDFLQWTARSGGLVLQPDR